MEKVGLTQEGRAPRNFLRLSAPQRSADCKTRSAWSGAAACLGAGDPPRGWAEAFNCLAILSSHAETPLSVESSHKLSATPGVSGPREKRSEPVRPQLGAGTLASPV